MGKHGHALGYARQLPQFEAFLETKRAPKTREAYGYALGHFAEFLAEWDFVQVGDSSTWNEDLPALFYQSLIASDRTWSSEQVHMHAVMQYFKYLDSALPFKVDEAKRRLKLMRSSI